MSPAAVPDRPVPLGPPSWPAASQAASQPWTWCDVAQADIGPSIQEKGAGTSIPVWRPASPPWQVLARQHGIHVAMSQRHGGVSTGPCASLNLGSHVGDDPASVSINRRRWEAALGVPAAYLEQVHGVDTVEAATALGPIPSRADAAWTRQSDLACQAMVADCLPVVFAHRAGLAVGAAHAGWRGLAAGVLERCLHALCEATGSAPQDFLAWGGACIGPGAFEVGAEVRDAFPLDDDAFQDKPGAPGKLWAHLPWLAQRRLARAGLPVFTWSGVCTVSDTSHAFSYRREPQGGRMVAAIWREGRC